MSEINEQDRLHQMLCAYVLGEADAAERSEIERALARDPALCEERDRLAATIGLVQNSLGKDETLSYRATSEVTRAAAMQMSGPTPAPRSIPWHQSTALRAAASIVAVVGASYLGWQAFVGRSEMVPRTLTAKLEPNSPGRPFKLGERVDESSVAAKSEERRLKTLGYAEADAQDSTLEFMLDSKPGTCSCT